MTILLTLNELSDQVIHYDCSSIARYKFGSVYVY